MIKKSGRTCFWLVTLSLFFIFPGCKETKPALATVISVPINYDSYDYGTGDESKIIDFGYLPNGLNSAEALFHDRVLQKQLAEQGWTLRGHGYKNGPEMLPYGDGRLDIMVLGDIPAFSNVFRHDFGIYAVSGIHTCALISGSSLAPSALKGKRIGYLPGSVMHFAVFRTLKAAHLGMDDIVSVPLAINEMELALREKRVDVITTYEPTTTTVLDSFPGTSALAKSEIYGYVMAGRGFSDRNPEILKAILAAYARCTRWCKGGDDNIYSLLGWVQKANIDFSGKSAIEINKNWVRILRRATIDNPSFPLLPLTIRDENGEPYQQLEFLKASGLLPADAEWKKIRDRFDTTFLPEVLQDGRKWKLEEFDYAPDRLDGLEEGKNQP